MGVSGDTIEKTKSKMVHKIILISSLLVIPSISLETEKTNPKAASPYTNCGCQCSSLTFRDKSGRVQGNCKSADHTGAQWCYATLTPVYPQPAKTSPTHRSGFQGNLGPMKHVPPLLVDITTEVSTMVATIMEDLTMEDLVMEEMVDLAMEEVVDSTMEDSIMEVSTMVDLAMGV